MMSQQRTRKAAGADPLSRGRPSVKGSGDTPSNVQNKQQRHRSRSKSKIPKNLRYDLENALVGLCDVWFEEIKPHLVRNNIKVHVHEGARGPASGDHGCLPPGAAGCSHLDPASTASACELCRLLFNAANSIESAVSQAASAALPASLTSSGLISGERAGLTNAGNPSRVFRDPASFFSPVRSGITSAGSAGFAGLASSIQTRVREYSRRVLTIARGSWLLESLVLRNINRFVTPYQSFEAKQAARRRKRYGASSQFHHDERQPRLCRTYSVIPPHTPRTPRPRRIQTAVETYGQYTEQPKPLFHGPRRRKLKMVDKSTQTPPLRCPATSTKVHLELEQTKATANIPCTRHSGTTDFVPKMYRQTSRSSALFKDDLIEIIAEQSEKQLRCIYKSPGRADSCSTFTLMTNYRTKYPTMRSKKKPWR